MDVPMGNGLPDRKRAWENEYVINIGSHKVLRVNNTDVGELKEIMVANQKEALWNVYKRAQSGWSPTSTEKVDESWWTEIAVMQTDGKFMEWGVSF